VGAEFSSAPPATPGEVHADAVWGTSYAYSVESVYVNYHGWAKAGGNVYAGGRIIRVCIWYTQDKRKSGTVCGDAAFSGGSWYPGAEVQQWFTDTLDSNAPQTIFHFSLSKIDPSIRY
jgi:hypothetical protein